MIDSLWIVVCCCSCSVGSLVSVVFVCVVVWLMLVVGMMLVLNRCCVDFLVLCWFNVLVLISVSCCLRLCIVM